MDQSILFVVNPESKGGKTGKTWLKTFEIIKPLLTNPHDFVIADGIGSGITSTLDGIKDGYTTIISVGGEGSNNEVANGIYRSGNKDVSLGFIKSGTANDYLNVINWPDSLEDQVELINIGKTIPTPITKVNGDSERISLNIADVGIGSSIAYMASVERRLKWVLGGFRYTLLALLGILKWKNIPLTVHLDDKEISGDLTFFMARFSTTSGEFKVLPHANTWGDKMAYTIAMDFKKLKMLRFMKTLKKGEHTEEIDGIYMDYASKIEFDAEKPLLFEVDGEPFSYDSSKVSMEAIPNALNVISTT